MRTTLTLDDDVAAQIERVRAQRDLGLKDVINEALRRGLRDMTAKPKRRERFQTGVHDGGKMLIENVRDALAVLDDEYAAKKLR